MAETGFVSRRGFCAGLTLAALVPCARQASAAPQLTAAVLNFGTVNWLLDVINTNKLDEKEGFSLQTLVLASNQAAQVALLGDKTDLMVADWFWVMRQRSLGGGYKFFPYSASLGSLMVPPGSPIQSVADLKGKRIGVAGGPLDKSWLITRAVAQSGHAIDLANAAQPVYGAPPLLNEQLKAGRLDALLNYWHYAAGLEAEGYRRALPVADMMKALGIESVLPLVGFVFPAAIEKRDPRLMRGFANAMQNAQKILLTSDQEWERIRPLMNAGSQKEFEVLRERYREGLLHTWSGRDIEAAAKLFEILAKTGGEELIGHDTVFDRQAFWDGLVF